MSETAPLRVYIAGPMRGLPRWNFPAFDAAAAYLRGRGFTVVNPAEMDREEYGDAIEFAAELTAGFFDEVMARDIAALATCDAIFLLRGWQDSRGANAELVHARAAGLRVIYDSPASVPTLAKVDPDRKAHPVARGVLDYFPDAIMAIANVSFRANEQHNPGEPMHWAKEKSTDHADCIARHLIDRGTLDTDGLRHTAKVAWRALALLQTELESA